MTGETFIEVGHYQTAKKGQGAEGDVFLSRKTEDDRIITVLSDGLGSGIKAGVLATLTATMAIRFIAEEIPIRRAARIIMKTLPVCKERKISYATFTIVDIDNSASVRIIEYDNPPYILIREGTQVEPIKTPMEVRRSTRVRTGGTVDISPRMKTAIMQYSDYKARAGDRLIFYSDGVSQSGMGSPIRPLGWGNPQVQRFALSLVQSQPGISARELAKRIVREAEGNDGYSAKDDITCGVVYFRSPRRLLVMTGPSVDPVRDKEMARIFSIFPGRKVICGGTTATILSRELGKHITVSLKDISPNMPPASVMEGAELVTEGIITLGKVAELLENPDRQDTGKASPAARIAELFMDSDQIDFVIGTRINEAHQDPTMPMELEIRRNIVKRIATLLEDKYLKDTKMQFM